MQKKFLSLFIIIFIFQINAMADQWLNTSLKIQVHRTNSNVLEIPPSPKNIISSTIKIDLNKFDIANSILILSIDLTYDRSKIGIALSDGRVFVVDLNNKTVIKELNFETNKLRVAFEGRVFYVELLDSTQMRMLYSSEDLGYLFYQPIIKFQKLKPTMLVNEGDVEFNKYEVVALNAIPPENTKVEEPKVEEPKIEDTKPTKKPASDNLNLEKKAEWILSQKDPYTILEISKGATPKEIEKSWRRLVQQFHPDKHNGAQWATLVFRKLTEAKELLLNGGSKTRDAQEKEVKNFFQAQYELEIMFAKNHKKEALRDLWDTYLIKYRTLFQSEIDAIQLAIMTLRMSDRMAIFGLATERQGLFLKNLAEIVIDCTHPDKNSILLEIYYEAKRGPRDIFNTKSYPASYYHEFLEAKKISKNELKRLGAFPLSAELDVKTKCSWLLMQIVRPLNWWIDSMHSHPIITALGTMTIASKFIDWITRTNLHP